MRTTRRLDAELSETKRVFQCRIREMKNEWLRKAQELQRYADRKDYKRFYAGLREVYGAAVPESTSVLSGDGTTLLAGAEDINLRWREYYVSLLNCKSAVDPSALDGMEQQPVQNILATLPRNEEVRDALAGLKTGKAPGKDGIPPEVMKHGGAVVVEQLSSLFGRCWETRTLLQDFRHTKIAFIFLKKGRRQ